MTVRTSDGLSRLREIMQQKADHEGVCYLVVAVPEPSQISEYTSTIPYGVLASDANRYEQANGERVEPMRER